MIPCQISPDSGQAETDSAPSYFDRSCCGAIGINVRFCTKRKTWLTKYKYLTIAEIEKYIDIQRKIFQHENAMVLL